MYTLINRKHKYPLSIHFFRQKGRISFPSPSIYQSPYYFQLNCPRISLNSEQTFFSLSSFCPPNVPKVLSFILFIPHYLPSVSSTDFHELNACTFPRWRMSYVLGELTTSLCSELISFIEKKAPTPFIRMKRKRPSLSSLSFFPSILPLPRTTNLSSPLDVAMLAFFFLLPPPRGPFPYSFSPFRPTMLV